MKRSVNFTGRKPMRADHIVSILDWLGISEAEKRVIAGAPLFVNLNGEETTPATLEGGRIHYTVGKRSYTASYRSADIHEVSDDGETWYEINDTSLID